MPRHASRDLSAGADSARARKKIERAWVDTHKREEQAGKVPTTPRIPSNPATDDTMAKGSSSSSGKTKSSGGGGGASRSPSNGLKKVKGENFYRDANKAKRVKLLSKNGIASKAIRDKDGNIIQAQEFQSSEAKPGRVQPDRRWFGEPRAGRGSLYLRRVC